MPLRWIEEREARLVIADAQHQALELPAVGAKTLWGEWLRRWLPGVDGGVESEINVEPRLR